MLPICPAVCELTSTRRSGRCRLLGRHGELGGVGMVAAILVQVMVMP
jgi:hypothetical protein